MNCSICLEEISNGVKVCCNNHIFHMKCAVKWKQESDRCPLCNTFMDDFTEKFPTGPVVHKPIFDCPNGQHIDLLGKLLLWFGGC